MLIATILSPEEPSKDQGNRGEGELNPRATRLGKGNEIESSKIEDKMASARDNVMENLHPGEGL